MIEIIVPGKLNGRSHMLTSERFMVERAKYYD